MAAVAGTSVVGVSLWLVAVVCAFVIVGDPLPADAAPAEGGFIDRASDLQRALRLLRKLLNEDDNNNNLMWTRSRNSNSIRKRSCAVGAGMTHHCTLMMLDKTLAMRDRLRNAISPGKKRSLPNPEFHLEKIELSDVDDLTPASRRELEVEQRLAGCQRGQRGCQPYSSRPASKDQEQTLSRMLADSGLLRQLLYGRVDSGAYIAEDRDNERVTS